VEGPAEAVTDATTTGRGDCSRKAATVAMAAVRRVWGPTDGNRATAQKASRAAPIAKHKNADVELTAL
jgi:hypothetical protein